MLSVGVRELRNKISQLLRRVREGETVEITVRGEVVARLVPAAPAAVEPEEMAAAWSELDQLAAEIGANWPRDVTAAEAVQSDRRTL